MPLHPAAQQMIRKVEELSGRPVHVAEDADLKVMAAITTARGSAPAHFLRYRPGTRAVDYLVAYQLGFLVRLFSCPADNRWDVVSNAAEQEAGIRLLGLEEYPRDFAVSMVGQLVVQLRSYSVGARVDDWIWNHLPELRGQQEQAVKDTTGRGAKRSRLPHAQRSGERVLRAVEVEQPGVDAVDAADQPATVKITALQCAILQKLLEGFILPVIEDVARGLRECRQAKAGILSGITHELDIDHTQPHRLAELFQGAAHCRRPA